MNLETVEKQIQESLQYEQDVCKAVLTLVELVKKYNGPQAFLDDLALISYAAHRLVIKSRKISAWDIFKIRVRVMARELKAGTLKVLHRGFIFSPRLPVRPN